MAIIRKKLGINVLEAANIRIKNIFAAGTKVYCNCSGGKDSIVLMSLLYDLVQSGEIDGSRLEVVFIDEEVIYPDVVRICEQWRKKFMLAGVKYTWYTIEHRNNNCFNALENNENFIPWDRYEADKWARPKPRYAVSESKYLKPRVENYQDFLTRSEADGITLIGVRTDESLNRYKYIAEVNARGGITGTDMMYPIYDWKDKDVWKYIKDRGLDFPEVYMRMWEAGCPKKFLRVCNLFAIDTCRQINYIMEIYPEMWEALLKREPNAYLVRLYWDTEMFHRQTKNRKRLENKTDEDEEDYRAKVFYVLNNPEKFFRNKHALENCKRYKRTVLALNGKTISNKRWKEFYEALLTGDTKGRSLRAFLTKIQSDYAKEQGMFQKSLIK